MTTMEIFMSIARRHTEDFMAAPADSDIHTGFRFGLGSALEDMAKLPELANDYAVQSIIKRIDHGMSALPIKGGDGRQWWEDQKAFDILCKMSEGAA